MAKATLRALSVLPFQATTTCSPRVAGGRGGATSTGLPASNSADSRAAMLGVGESGSGRPTITRSKIRP